MYPEHFSMSVMILAIVASCGGTALRYIEETRFLKKLRTGFMFADLIGSAFTGFFLGWYLLDADLLNLPEVMLVLILAGFLGSKIFNLVSYILFKKLGINLKFVKNVVLDIPQVHHEPKEPVPLDKEKEDDSKRHPQQ